MKYFLLITLLLVLLLPSLAQDSLCSCLHWGGAQGTNNSSHSDDVWLCKGDYTSLILINGKIISGRLIEVHADTLTMTNFLSPTAAKKHNGVYDTLEIPIAQLNKIRLVADRSLGLYTHTNLHRESPEWVVDSAGTRCQPFFTSLYTNDTLVYEIIPIYTAQGYDFIFEENGDSYYYRGSLGDRTPVTAADTVYRVSNVIALTPCKREQINGIAVGYVTSNSKNDHLHERDSLVVHGLALELDIFDAFVIFYANSYIQFYDDWEYFDETLRAQWSTRVKGIHIALGITGSVEDSGVAIAPLAIVASSTTGISIGGLYNVAFLQRGVALAGLHCRSARTRGIQIGVYNKSSDLRGIQIGLWNSNPKRSLPLINWQFSPKKPRS